MNKKDIISFFDSCAPTWDAEMMKDDRIINTILDIGGISAGRSVLDVACGTGVLFDYYLSRNACVTGIDISPEMVQHARKKFPDIPVICADVEEFLFEFKFDCIVLYNAFPHFPDPERLIRILSSLLKPHGRLTVAHGMSREMINMHHSGSASSVSLGLMSADELSCIFSKFLNADVKVSDEEKYIVSGFMID